MSSTTNPNTCAKCRSPLTATYYYARGGAETHVDWWCTLCDPAPTNNADPVATLTADRDALRRLAKWGARLVAALSERDGAHLSIDADEWDDIKAFQARIDAALREGGVDGQGRRNNDAVPEVPQDGPRWP